MSSNGQGALSFFRRFANKTDLELGDPLFDQQVIIDSASPELVAEFLTPPRQAAVLTLLDGWREAKITNNSVWVASPGRERNLGKMSSTIHRLIDTAVVLGDPAPVQDALELQGAGYMGEAAARLHEIDDAEPNSFVELLEAETLTAMGRHDEGAAVLNHAAERIPANPDVVAWSEVAAKPNPLPKPALPTLATTVPLDWEAVVTDLFAGVRRGHEIVEHFEARYLDRTVTWSCEVLARRPYRIDTDFGNDPGVKATIRLGTVQTSRIVNRIEAVIQLGPDVNRRLGSQVKSTGTLLRIDRFSRKFYIGNAVVT
ncbi:MAG: hypothetical protein ACI91O_001618 [Candidatus Poriferisodalaceae bacterium]